MAPRNPISRAFTARTDGIDVKSRAITAVVSTQAPDRYGTVFLSRGCDLSAYQRNSVVLWVHGKDPNRGERPIAKTLSIKVDESAKTPRLIARMAFNTDPFSDQLFQDYKEGFLNAFSVRALPIDFGRPTPDETRRNPTWSSVEVAYRKWELLELSACGVPGNAECVAIGDDEARGLRAMVARGYFVNPVARASLDKTRPIDPRTGKPLPPLRGRTFEECVAEAEKAVADWKESRLKEIAELGTWFRNRNR